VTAPLAHRCAAALHPDPARVVARLLLPGEEPAVAHSRAGAVVAHVLALHETEVAVLAQRLRHDFAGRHRHYVELLGRHASIVGAHVGDRELSPDRTLVLGASFTAEYATEGAALCNPSAVHQPDQSGLAQGQLRVAVSLRAIGEGHMSCISFATAVIGPGAQWVFEPRPLSSAVGSVTPARWRRRHLRAVLADQGHIDELGSAVLHALPIEFIGTDLDSVLAQTHPDLLARPGAQASVDLMRKLVASAYRVDFDADTVLAQRVLLPSAAEESNGMEDARFTRFVDDAGVVTYRATYTAYDGRRIAPRLLTSPDLRSFHAHRLSGPAARNKGMALFPRLVGGRHLALCRTDGQSISLAVSADGYTWSQPQLVHAPTASWELLQVGNCGPPIETEAGWLVLTHGVGVMRSYAVGAILLDLDDPSIVLARLDRPLLQPESDERDGYVPHVVYSCGGVLHQDRVWVPYGIGDARIGVAWVELAEVLTAMTRATTP